MAAEEPAELSGRGLRAAGRGEGRAGEGPGWARRGGAGSSRSACSQRFPAGWEAKRWP